MKNDRVVTPSVREVNATRSPRNAHVEVESEFITNNQSFPHRKLEGIPQ